jgi:hypothetical protein
MMPTTAPRCHHCGAWLEAEDGGPEREWLDEEEERPRRRRRRSKDVEATDFLIPTNVSGWALASCYLGLIGFCLPIVGLVFAFPAFIFGIIALLKPAKRVSYGSVTGNIRAVIGLILSGLAIIGWGGLLLFILANPRSFR